MKTYRLEFTTSSEAEFLSLPQNIQRRIKLKMEFFIKQINPLEYAKKLRGSKNTYRFRIGDYRVIITPQDRHTFIILLILKIGHRREVYE